MNSEPPPSQHGLKTAAGLKLTRFLRQIADEKTECHDLDPKTGQGRLMSKAEALARIIWKLALGYDETVKTEDALVVKHHKPDPKFVDIVYDRLEGKVAANNDGTTKKQPLSGKVDALAKDRLNAMVEDKENGV